MARPAGVSPEEIIVAVEKLLTSGEKPTINRIREVLGDRGSPAFIGRILKDMKSGVQTVPVESDAVDQQQQSFEMVMEPVKTQEPQQATPVASPVPQAQAEQSAPAESTVTHQAQTNEHVPVVTPGAEPRHFERRDRPGFKRRDDHRHRDHHDDQGSRYHDNQQHSSNAPSNHQPEIYQTENLETMSDRELAIKIRRLEIYLNKEQSRREAAEKMAREAKEYADAIKEQIGQRITDLRQTMEETINQLKAEARELKASAEVDLKFYREQLEKANKKIISLLNDNPEQKSS